MGKISDDERELLDAFKQAGIPPEKIVRGAIPGRPTDTSFFINGEHFDFIYDSRYKEWSIQSLHLLNKKQVANFIKGLSKRQLGAYRYEFDDDESGFKVD